ncbi:uncharacterized protein N7483_004603 [Penicillium malachiteum]|uniref:uncharacterized protein n=1 Tax=Penicillium malachiteum TaxID=1324776 RepID=UPI0025470727|nr:uncharacterized protein N7483_004603 [Penicillium malachiteum]KAJ5730095.1 hypothetical protein N7483_004603 [Penicillium malachiteum]
MAQDTCVSEFTSSDVCVSGDVSKDGSVVRETALVPESHVETNGNGHVSVPDDTRTATSDSAAEITETNGTVVQGSTGRPATNGTTHGVETNHETLKIANGEAEIKAPTNVESEIKELINGETETKKLTNGVATKEVSAHEILKNGIVTNGDVKSENKPEEDKATEAKVEVKVEDEAEKKIETTEENKTETKDGEEVKDETKAETKDDKKEKEKEEEKTYEPPGSIIDVHKLYEIKSDDKVTWTNDFPESLVEPAENEESAQYALLLRHSKCYNGRRNLSLHSIVIQSDPLKKFLGKVLENYPRITTTLQRLEFTSPFKPFVHRWEQLLKFREEEEDLTTKKHADLLHKTLVQELGDILSEKRDLISNGVITHELLWTIFEPDDVFVHISEEGRSRAYAFVEEDTDSSKTTVVTGKAIEFNGKKFGYIDTDFKIWSFDGTMPITDLIVYPLRYHTEKDTLRESLIARGKRWEEHKGYHYKAYEGMLYDDLVGERHVKSRVIIDAEAFNLFHPSKTIRTYDSNRCPQELGDEDRLIASPMVHGYSLKEKEWFPLYVEYTKEIEWSTDAFESLVPIRGQEDLKDLLLGVAIAQSQKNDIFDDIIPGKGQGIIMQLSGPSGVGKTLTAECVAEEMRAPMYTISASELGYSTDRMERKLKDIFRMIVKWGAVLLLNEADMFMETRDVRNELVSVFLRMLDNYDGILFLTTNRAIHVDPAFESRIHLAIAFEDQDIASRRQIWTQLLKRIQNNDEFTSAQLANLSLIELNGRDIRKTIKLASLMALSKKTKLGYQMIQTVLKTQQKSSQKLNFYI